VNSWWYQSCRQLVSKALSSNWMRSRYRFHIKLRLRCLRRYSINMWSFCPRDLCKASAKLSHKLTKLTGIILSTLLIQFLSRYREIAGDFCRRKWDLLPTAILCRSATNWPRMRPNRRDQYL